MTMIDVESLKRQTDMRIIVSRYAQPVKPIGKVGEMHSACPFCGCGRDRFHTSPGVAGCRVCKWGGDVIKFVRQKENLDFMGAIEFLNGGAVTQQTPIKPSSIPEQSFSETEEQKRAQFLAHAPVIMDAAHRRLMTEDTPGGDFLLGRGLNLDTWATYRLGYVDAVNGKPASAVALPWYRGGKLTAIRYRMLEAADSSKRYISEYGSQAQRLGVLFGGQALTPWTRHSGGDPCGLRTLVICEGEINAMSVWQVAHAAKVDVLSIGSESAAKQFSPNLIDYARRYRMVLVWLDKECIAQEAAKMLGASAFWSEADGKKTDANDYLKAGKLAGILVKMLRKATPVGKQEALQMDLLDGGLL